MPGTSRASTCSPLKVECTLDELSLVAPWESFSLKATSLPEALVAMEAGHATILFP